MRRILDLIPASDLRAWVRPALMPAAFLALALPAVAAAQPAAKTLDMYFIDTEGGQSTLFIAPGGQTVLIDTGNPGTRDAGRIMEAVHAAGAQRIDYLLITHYHADHVGGFLELSKMIPIAHFIDHGPDVETRVFDSRTAYEAAVATAPHTIAKPGDKLPIPGIEWTIVSSAGKVLPAAMAGAPGAGLKNPYCADYKPKDIQEGPENAQSVGSVIRYGKFRAVDLGDLLWNYEAQLACPVNRIGTVDLMLTTHHGLAWSGVPALIDTLHPRVVIMNNGIRKGGEIETFKTLESAPGLEDLWELHWSANAGLAHNVAGRYIANLETPTLTGDIIAHPPAQVPTGKRPPDIGDPDHSPAYWLKVSAQPDGSFTVTNSRNGFTKSYGR
jgi:beta-lactamase superfamily II metal-dependent hydrolase